MNDAPSHCPQKSHASAFLSIKKPVFTTIWLVTIFFLVLSIPIMAKNHGHIGLFLAGFCGILLGGGLRNFIDEWRHVKNCN